MLRLPLRRPLLQNDSLSNSFVNYANEYSTKFEMGLVSAEISRVFPKPSVNGVVVLNEGRMSATVTRMASPWQCQLW